MWRVTLDRGLFRVVVVIIIIAGLMPFVFIVWDKLLISENITNESGIIDIEKENLTCGYECCDSGPVIKYCEGNLKCVNSKCVKNKCPLECCPGTEFERKDCNKGFACINNVCRYAKELCGNGKCDPDHLECEYCKHECMFEHPNGTLMPIYYYFNETCRPYVTPENTNWFIDPDDKLVEAIVDTNILLSEDSMWNYFELAQQWVIQNIADNEPEIPYPSITEALNKREGTDRERAFIMTSMFLDIVQKKGLLQSEISYEIKSISFPTKEGEHYFVVVQFDSFQNIYDTNSYFNNMTSINREIVEVWDKLFMKYGVISPRVRKQMSHDYLVYQRPGSQGEYILPFIYTGHPVNITQ